MASVPSLKNISSVLDEFRNRLEDRAGITNLGSDTAIRSIIDALASQIVDDRYQTRNAFFAGQISTASGRDLDALALTYGLERLQPTFAEVGLSDRSLMFYAPDGATFGDLNNGNDIVLLASTIVSSDENSSGNARIQYKLLADYALPAASSSKFCSAKALTFGSSQNVGANVLLNHDFTNYSDSLSASLKVTNVFPILNGRELERDEQLRFRVSNHYNSLASSNTTKLQLLGLQVPGVLDVRIVPSYFGIGTCAVIVFAAEHESNQSLVASVQRKINAVQAPGLRVIAIPGIKVQFDFDISILVKQPITDSNKARLRNSIRRSINTYFNELGVEGTLNIEDIRKLVLSDNPEIFGLAGRQVSRDLFRAIYIRKSYSTNISTSERETLISNTYSLNADEFARSGSINITFGSVV